MIDKRYCRKCGADILEGNDHCIFCGSNDIGIKIDEQERKQPKNTRQLSLGFRIYRVVFFIFFFIVLGIIISGFLQVF